MNSVKKFVARSKGLREYWSGHEINKKFLRGEWTAYWWSDQIADASW